MYAGFNGHSSSPSSKFDFTAEKEFSGLFSSASCNSRSWRLACPSASLFSHAILRMYQTCTYPYSNDACLSTAIRKPESSEIQTDRMTDLPIQTNGQTTIYEQVLSSRFEILFIRATCAVNNVLSHGNPLASHINVGNTRRAVQNLL